LHSTSEFPEIFPKNVPGTSRIDLTRARCTDVDIVVAWGDLTTEMGTAGASKGLTENRGKSIGKITRKPGKMVIQARKNWDFHEIQGIYG